MASDEKLIENKNYVNELIDRIGYGKYQTIMMIIFTNINISLGMNYSLVNILPFILSHLRTLTVFEISLLPMSYLIGLLTFYSITLFYGDSADRLKIINISSVMFIITGFLTSSTDNIYLLSLIRLLNGGFGIIVCSLSSAYLAECYPSKYRGACSLFYWFSYSVGELLFVLGCLWLFPNFDNNYWKYLAIMSVIPTIVFLVCLLIFLKESPLYLVRNNNHERAIEVLNNIARVNSKELCSDEEIRLIYTMKATVEETVIKRFKQIIKKSLVKKHVIMISIWTLTVSSYYGIYLTFPYILEKMSTKTDLIWVMIYCYSSQIPATILFSITVEIKTLGRMLNLIFSLTIVIIFSFLLAFDLDRTYMIISTAIVYGFSGGNFNLLYSYTPEIYNTEIRVASLSFINAVSRFIYLFCPYMFLYFQSIDPVLIYFFIMLSSFIVIILILSLKIETKDKILDTFTN